MERSTRIGYLLKAFPVISETFILNEILAMEHHKVPLAILSLKEPEHRAPHARVQGVESPHSCACANKPWRWPKLALDHLLLWLSDPGRYRTALQAEVGRHLWGQLSKPSRIGFKILRKRLRRFVWAGWVARRAHKLRIQHFHAHYAGEPLRVAHIVKRLTGIEYSFTAHAKDLYQAPDARLARRLQSARFATSCHQHGVDTLRALLPEGDRERVLFVRHGIDTEFFSGRENRPPTRKILAVGRLTKKKGFDTLIEACRLLAAENEDFECNIIGDGRLREALEAQIEESALESRVTLHGFQSQASIRRWYRDSDVLALPCRELPDGNRDGVPNVLLEAIASGLPVVASDAAGVTEVVENKSSALLVAPDDAPALAKSLRKTLSGPSSAARRALEAQRAVGQLNYLKTNLALVAELKAALDSKVDRALTAAAHSAWNGGLASKAAKRLGIKPKRIAVVEETICGAIRPGIRANAWRPDLERLASRRLFDEAVKGNRLPRLQPLLALAGTPKERVLDLGCGRGGLAVALEAKGVRTTALDLRFRNCRVAQLRAQRYGKQLDALTSSGESLPFANGSFRAVACMEVLEHVQDPAGLLREVNRVLEPGGRCLVTVINRYAHFDPHYHLWGINFVPRKLANWYIDKRKRNKVSYRDCQTLDEMHYFSYREFVRFANRLGFDVERPERKRPSWHPAEFLKWGLSLGFNTVTVVLTRSADQPVTVSHPKERSLSVGLSEA